METNKRACDGSIEKYAYLTYIENIQNPNIVVI